MDVTPEPTKEVQASLYDLLCQIVDPQQARHVTRILTDLCHCDQNSYPFLQGVLSITQLRLALTLPEAVAKRLSVTLEEFHQKSQVLIDSFDERQIGQKRSAASSGWPLNKVYTGKVACFLQTIIKRFEEIAAYRVRWLVVCGLITVASSSMGLDRYHASVLSRTKQQGLDQYLALQSSSNEQVYKIETQCKAAIEQRSDEIASQKLQALEPRSYHLAQLIEKAGRRVKLANGTIAWEVVVTHPPALPLPGYKSDEKLHLIVTIYFPYLGGEMALSSTAPGVDAKSKARSR